MQCEFDQKNPNEPCRDCKRRGTNCGKTLPAQIGGVGGRTSDSQSMSPSPSESSSVSPYIGPTKSESDGSEYEEQLSSPPQPRTSPVSSMLENAAKYARRLESGSRSTEEVLEGLRSCLVEGDFGELRLLLLPPSSQEESTKYQPSSQAVLPEITVAREYRSYQQSVPYQQDGEITAYANSGTVNPATLTRTMVDPITQFNYSEALALDYSPPPNYETLKLESEYELVYNYVGIYGRA